METIAVGTIALTASALLLVCTGICGLWLRANPSKRDESSLRFHATIGLLAMLAGLVTTGGVTVLGW